MNTNAHELRFKQEAFDVVSCAIAVLNALGHGLHEKIYENALCVEFALRGLGYRQQVRYRVDYKGEIVGEFVPDLVMQNRVIIETKTIERITDHERGQMLNYLRITALPLGLILNFKHARLEWERMVLTHTSRVDPRRQGFRQASATTL